MGAIEFVQSQSCRVVVLVHTCSMYRHPQIEVASHRPIEITPRFALIISHPSGDLVEYVFETMPGGERSK